ncbi:T9SS type A sorting domain-containing protein [Ignavibacterium sp.]|uniref:T9SS type A sorting domain-containing protein n=1 Tax=Ignavibacterium sp. TaxID=2651167 RepID=UPI00220C9A4B|nr:T9SS type A sorting domain-containing protein [Ignavibacterium sp.]BDQ01609.1 MAG: hypothetical protein KatS3mg037_0184 [Ignavibacterium sp.]
MKKLFIIISLLNFTIAFSQEFSFVKIPFELNYSLTEGKILPQSNATKDTLHCYYSFFRYGNQGYHSISYDKGKNWSSPEYLGIWNQFDVLHTDDNRRVICYILLGSLKIKTYDINGNVFEKSFQINTGTSNLQIRKLGNGAGIFYSSINNIYAFTSSDLINWSLPANTIYSEVNSFQILKLKNDKYFLAFTKLNEENLYYTFSDDMINWQVPKTLLTGIPDSTRFVAEQNDSGEIILALEKFISTPFSEFKQKDILILTSVDYGSTWSSLTSITKFKGDDNLLSLTAAKNDFILSFSSKREKEFPDYYFGFLLTASDKHTPPFVYDIQPESENPENINALRFFAKIDDDEPLKYAKLNLKFNNEAPVEVFMNDKGFDGDERQFDKIYTVTLMRKFQKGDAASYFVLAEDLSGNKTKSEVNNLFVPIDYQMTVCSLTNNRFKLSFNNSGILADINPPLGNFDESTVLFSGGFLLTGYENSNLFESLVFSPSRFQDYIPGIVNGSQDDPKNQIYIVRADDPPFGESWQLYKYATMLNAPFYDGDFDGVYNPVDKNNNGIWDEDEDAPEILGDVTTWCVFNDAVPSFFRRNDTMKPLGIEIQQSVFSFDKNENNQPDEKIYIRYRIINRGNVSEVLDSVLFSFLADPDIDTEYQNDYMGTDTTLNLAYCYSQQDPNFGLNPPASGIALLQGPPVFIPGETFIDNNSNGIFDETIDIAVDTAVFKNGSLIPAKKIIGAKNSELFSSFALILHSMHFQANFRLNQQGFMNAGSYIDICNNLFGTVYGNYNCNEINPLFHFSGNPVIPDGWVMNTTSDIRYLLTTGFFQLKKDEPVDIWGVYVAGRGVDSLDSITEMKKNTQSAIRFYKNFPVNEERIPPIEILPTEYKLYQNFPNPFNNGTRIRFEIPKTEFVKLKVFDITGSEVVTLINETKPAGEYEVIMKSDNLSSGVYFYQITAGGFISTKKCVVIK